MGLSRFNRKIFKVKNYLYGYQFHSFWKNYYVEKQCVINYYVSDIKIKLSVFWWYTEDNLRSFVNTLYN